MRPTSHPSGPIVANMHVATSHDRPVLHELASGVDALYLSGHGYLSKGFLARLEEERTFADRVSVPVPFELGPLTLGLAPHGWGKYRYCLDHETGRIGFTSSRRLPSVRIQPRAEFLHAVGPEETVRHFADLVRPFIEGLVLSVARLDLFVDMEGMQLCSQDRSAFVCRGDGCTTYENANIVTGFAFGSRRTQRISARLYDKTAEMAVKGNDWWELVWGERHTPGVAGVADRVRSRAGRPERPRPVPPRGRACRRAVALGLLHRGVAHLALSDCRLQPLPLAGRSALAGRALGVTGARRDRIAFHPKSEAGHIVGQPHAGPRRLPRGLCRSHGDDRLRRSTIEALRASVANDEIVRRMTFAERVERRRAERGFR